MKLGKCLMGSFCGLVLVNAAFAQQPGERTRNPTGQTEANSSIQGSLQAGESAQDSTLAMQRAIESCLSLDNQAEVVLAKLATEKGKHKDVIALAKNMHAAHGECLAELNKVAPWLADQQPLNVASTIASSGGTSVAQAKAARTTTLNPTTNGPANGDSTMIKMQAELAQQCLTDTEAFMTKDGGKDFDECYVGMQLARHAAMHSKLTVFQRHTSGELNQFITDGIAKNKSMMADATALMKRLSKEALHEKTSE